MWRPRGEVNKPKNLFFHSGVEFQVGEGAVKRSLAGLTWGFCLGESPVGPFCGGGSDS